MPSPTRYVVGGFIAIALLLAMYASLGLHLGLIAGAFGVYEAWTLVNRYPNDTISEIVWQLAAERPLVPFLFGTLSAWLVMTNTLPNMVAVAAWFFLMSHFFFQRKG